MQCKACGHIWGLGRQEQIHHVLCIPYSRQVIRFLSVYCKLAQAVSVLLAASALIGCVWAVSGPIAAATAQPQCWRVDVVKRSTGESSTRIRRINCN